jgi:eukaryotic-like serine/threonine-protein kinase
MPLAPGSKLGPYEILAQIGAGGMGEVYQARDTRLNRIVAVKVSSQQFSERFEREARVIASLNHPNICTLYDVGPNYLVMELIEGPTLADRIKEGAIPLEESLAIARQIAEALEVAHEKGVVHRDLKPGNVKIKPGGTVKVLDFGLAKVGATPTAHSDNSPTITMDETQAGVILGTAGYMSPEQARGKPVDRRADIWSFGVVLYEMLIGKRLFGGETITDTLAAVLEREPDWKRVPVPAHRLLRRCLAKDPANRLRDIGDALPMLEDAATAPSGESASHKVAYLSAIGALALALAGLAFFHFRESPPEAQTLRYTLPFPDKGQLQNLAISPDGHLVVMEATGEAESHLFVRALDSLQAQLLAGTDGAAYPFWSFDSHYIGFFADGKLKKVAATGGPVQTLCDVAGGRSGTWNQDGVLVFGDNGYPLRRVSSAGGSPAFVNAASTGDQRFPAFLPDGNRFLYTATESAPGIHVGSLDGSADPKRAPLVPDISRAFYIPPVSGARTGSVLFVRQQTLMAQPVDPKTLAPAGDVFPVAEQIAGGINTAEYLFSFSRNGILTYRAGAGTPLSVLTWIDRTGKTLGTAGEPGPYAFVQLSPDATKAAVTKDGDVWIVDLIRQSSIRLTFDRNSIQPLWSPDGTRVMYRSTRDRGSVILVKEANGAGSEQVLYKAGAGLSIFHWSPDGKFLNMNSVVPPAPTNFFVLPLSGEDALKPRPILQPDLQAIGGRFSPDSKWIAYRSAETGRNETYVQPFNGSSASGKWMISKGSQGMPRWRHDQKELYYLSTDGQVMAVPIETTPTFHAGEPVPLFRTPSGFLGRTNTPGTIADAAPDGKRFIFVMPVSQSQRDEFTVVVNWQAGLKK